MVEGSPLDIVVSRDAVYGTHGAALHTSRTELFAQASDKYGVRGYRTGHIGGTY